MKATYGEITHGDRTLGSNNNDVEPREIFKDPITDDGTKKSKKGLLTVNYKLSDCANQCDEGFCLAKQSGGSCKDYSQDEYIQVVDQCTWEQEQTGLLITVFKDGKLTRTTTLDEIRKRLSNEV